MYRDIKDVLNKTVENPVTDCLEWPGKPMNAGYIYISYKSKKILLHRLIYQECINEIPNGLQVLHKCDNRICCNPEHLFLGTNLDNIHDKIDKGRANVSLHTIEIKKIIELYNTGMSKSKISEVLKISRKTVIKYLRKDA